MGIGQSRLKTDPKDPLRTAPQTLSAVHPDRDPSEKREIQLRLPFHRFRTKTSGLPYMKMLGLLLFAVPGTFAVLGTIQVSNAHGNLREFFAQVGMIRVYEPETKRTVYYHKLPTGRFLHRSKSASKPKWTGWKVYTAENQDHLTTRRLGIYFHAMKNF